MVSMMLATQKGQVRPLVCPQNDDVSCVPMLVLLAAGILNNRWGEYKGKREFRLREISPELNSLCRYRDHILKCPDFLRRFCFGKIAADYPGFVPIENDVDFLKKSGKEIFVGSVKLGLTAEFSETQTEKRGTQVFGANPPSSSRR